MFVAGMVAGLIGQSSGLIADSLDMFADAVAYGIALSAFNRGTAFEARAAMASGGALLVLGRLPSPPFAKAKIIHLCRP
jgi:Co/Zn/Cd efflux system component